MAIVERLREFGKSDPADDTWAAMDVMHEAADLITELVEALEPFEQAAAEAEKRMKEHGLSENASPGLGIRFKHLFGVRAALAAAQAKRARKNAKRAREGK